MSGSERREQLLDVGRSLFAERGFDGTSVEEVALRAGVSKPVVYEHFGGKDGLYAVVVEREVSGLVESFADALSGSSPHELLEQACLVLLTYVEQQPEGFRILIFESPVGVPGFTTLMSQVATQVEHVLAREFAARGLDATLAPLYSQALVGMVAMTGQWWQGHQTRGRDEVAGHLVGLAWGGLRGLSA